MPINSEGIQITYTSNQDIQYLLGTPGEDFTVELTAYIVEIFGRNRINTNDDQELFKAVITNGSKRILLLIWDSSLMTKLQELFVPNKILHLDGCQGHTVRPTKKSIKNNLINYEIIIQPGSVVKEKGFHVQSIVEKSIPTIKFIDIAKATGEFEVKAYIKTVVAPSYNRSGLLNFGTGSITDGVHKVPINVQSFNKKFADHLSKGICVLIRATVPRSGNLRLICKDMSYLKVLADEEILTEEVVQNANKPLKRCAPNAHLNDEANSFKKICIRPALQDKTNSFSTNDKLANENHPHESSYMESSF